MSTLMAKYQMHLREQKRVVETIRNTLIDHLVFYPQKYLYWAAENGSGPFELEEKKYNKCIATNELDLIYDALKPLTNEIGDLRNCKEILKESAVRMRTYINSMIDCESKISEELAYSSSFFFQSVLPNNVLKILHTPLAAVKNLNAHMLKEPPMKNYII